MKRITTKLLGLFALGALAAGLAAMPALADAAKDKDKDKTKDTPAKKADVHLNTVKVEVHASVYKVLKRKAVAHKPIEMVDPKTKKKYKPDDMVKAPNGQQVKASVYFAKVNELEVKPHEIGHSRRDSGKTTLVQSQINTAELDKKAEEAAKKHRKFDPKTMRAVVKRDVQENRFHAAAKKDEAR